MPWKISRTHGFARTSFILAALIGSIYFLKSHHRQKWITVSPQDCGTQSLHALLTEFQITASLDKIKEIAETDEETTTMLGLKKAAQAYGMNGTGKRLMARVKVNLFVINEKYVIKGTYSGIQKTHTIRCL